MIKINFSPQSPKLQETRRHIKYFKVFISGCEPVFTKETAYDHNQLQEPKFKTSNIEISTLTVKR